MRTKIFIVAISAVALWFTGCATLINQDTQPVLVNTNDSKSATVTVAYKDGSQTGETPLVVQARRSGDPLVITVKEDDCTAASSVEKNATVSGAFFVNAIWCFSCVFSTTTDAATGRMWRYDEQIVIPVTRKCDSNS
ncbi:MAG: hypothetical protein LBJ88_02775 [Campylobacteraceae bacterium]|jgi:hypothetical protein|nr:hypothetical protein [Campylobacteraceae bacterium]